MLFCLAVAVVVEARSLRKRSNYFTGNVGQVNSYNRPGGPYYGGGYYPGGGNYFNGANIGMVNQGCGSPYSCGIYNSQINPVNPYPNPWG